MPSSIISTTSTSTTQSKNPFASKNETKFLNHQQNNTLLHAGNKLHVATYSRDTHSNSFKTHESQIAMMRDDVINQYTRNCFDIVEHSNHEINHLESYKQGFSQLSPFQKRFQPDMAFRIQENFTELSNTELEDSKNTNPNFDQLMEIKNTNPSKLPKIKKLYFVHSKILLTCSYFKDIIFNLKAGSQSPMPLQIQNSDSIFFPILDLNWSKPATLTILRFFYTREVSADIYNTEVLNEVCQIAGQLQNEDLDFALTHLKRKSLVQKQEKMNIFKVPSLNKKHKKRSKDGTFSSEKESNSMTDDSSMVDADNPKNPFAPKNKNTNKKNEKPALPAKNKSKNPFATGDEAGAEDAKAQHPEKFAGSTSKFFTQSWVDKCGTVIRSDSEESSASKETSEKSTPVKKNNSSRRF